MPKTVATWVESATNKLSKKTKRKMKKNFLLFFCFALFAISSRAQVVFTDSYGPGVAFADFGGATNNVSVDVTQHHLGTSSLKCQVPASNYTGGAFYNSTPQNLSAYNCVSFWVKASKSATLNVAGLGNNGATNVMQVEYNAIALTTSWTKVIIPIPNPSKLTSESGMFHFAEGAEEGAYTIWFDDIQYENLNSSIIGAPTASIATETISRYVGDGFTANGVSCQFPVNSVIENLSTSKRYFKWLSSNKTVATIDSTGTGLAKAVGTTLITAQLGTVVATGTLTVNVSAAVVPTVAAPEPPIRNASDVISFFSGRYTDLPGTDWFPNWGQTTVVTEVNIASNPTKKYASFNYQGVQFQNPVNATTMAKMHIDIWTPDCTAFDIYPIDGHGAAEKFVTVNPVALGWNSYDIDLTAFTNQGLPLDDIIQFKFVGTPFGSSNVYLDNIYFYKGNYCCSAPAGGLRASNLKATSVKLKWKSSTCGSGLRYRVQYKPSTSGTWIIKDVADTTVLLKNLTPSTTYQWKVATICQESPIAVSAYKNGTDFVTPASFAGDISMKVSTNQNLNAIVYPNPAKSSASIKIENNISAVNISVSDLTGKVIWQSQNVKGSEVKIPLENFVPGMYLVSVTNGKETKIIKLVKE